MRVMARAGVHAGDELQLPFDLVASLLQQLLVGHLFDTAAGIMDTGHDLQQPRPPGAVARAQLGIQGRIGGIAELAHQDHRVVLRVVQQHAHRVAPLEVDALNLLAHAAVKAPILQLGANDPEQV